MKRNHLWEEKNSTDQSVNLLKNEKNDNSDTTTETKNPLVKNECNGIGKIYLITNNINGKRYVGQTIQKISWRWTQHLKASKISNRPLYRAIRKYGSENFNVIELESTSDLTLLDDIEKKHIKEQKSFINWNQGGYNLTDVKDLGCSIEDFKKYIESKFQNGMSWENYGHDTWHLDHITPLDAFNLSDRNQFLVASHYTNYQPLWAKDNYSKSNTIN